MKYINSIRNILTVFFVFFFLSCGSRKDIVYYQDIDGLKVNNQENTYELKIQQDDLLMIVVSADSPEISSPFNLKAANVVTVSNQDFIGRESAQLYLVDSKGIIDFPVLGKLKISGLTRTAVVELIKSKISLYIKNPIVNLRVMNFKVAVQGEVISPGVFTINSERITLPEALSMAKDLTVYGTRNNILIIREIDGVKTFNRVDLTKSDFIYSPFYYLSQNDIIYVEPNKSKINASKIGPDTGVVISAASILVTLITLIISITK